MNDRSNDLIEQNDRTAALPLRLNGERRTNDDQVVQFGERNGLGKTPFAKPVTR